MGNSYFSFKRFTVHQSRSAMKVGTDGVLLGAWWQPSPGIRTVLDIGCGTGLIALMAAQRCPEARIDAIDIDAPSCEDAQFNFNESPWAERLHLHNLPLQQYVRGCPLRYDHILSNPPYFNNSLLSPDPSRTRARHSDSLPYGDLAEGCSLLLAPGGALSVILPTEEGRIFAETARRTGLYPVRSTQVRTRPGTPPKRILLEFRREKGPVQESLLVMEEPENGHYTEAYKALTRDFYLRF